MTAINGIAAGGGVGLALAGDIAVAAETAKFKLSSGPIWGLFPTWAPPGSCPICWSCTRQRLALLGDNLSASDAKTWGLIWDCVADEELMPTALNIAGRLADGPTAGLKSGGEGT